MELNMMKGIFGCRPRFEFGMSPPWGFLGGTGIFSWGLRPKLLYPAALRLQSDSYAESLTFCLLPEVVLSWERLIA